MCICYNAKLMIIVRPYKQIRDIFELHEVIDETEVALSKKFKCVAVIHMDPIDVKNERLNQIKLFMLNELPKECTLWFITGQAQFVLVYKQRLHPYVISFPFVCWTRPVSFDT